MCNMYHFTDSKLRDSQPIPAIGEWLEYTGEIRMCVSGLHASKHPFYALRFAPGLMLHKVRLEQATHTDDKSVGRRRKIIASIDLTGLLHEFARWCALQLIDKWDAPDVVHEYLETGNISLRVEARAAVWSGGGEEVARWAAAVASRAAVMPMAVWSMAREVAEAEVGMDWGTMRDKQRTKFKELVDEAFGD